MKFSTIFIAIVSLLMPFSGFASGHGINSEYSRHLYVDSINIPIPYRLLEPVHATPDTRYPLVLFLHGSGERGTDNESQLANGGSLFTNPIIEEKFPAFVLFPQCKEKTWTEKPDPRNFMPGAPVPPESMTEKALMNLLREVIREYPVDTSRIYVMGISMGGIAAYDLVCRHPDVFAAAIPICGAINPDRLADAKDVKFMIFHGSDDEEVPSIASRTAYRTLNSLGADVDYIEFTGVGHECWTDAFNFPDMLPWLFSQKKSGTNTPIDADLTYNK